MRNFSSDFRNGASRYHGQTFFQIVCFLERIHTKPIQSLILSACRPSILDGFRDFTPYGKYLVSYKDEITKSVQALYGNSGKGVYEVALAEWNYQNNKCFDALVLVTGTIPLLESEQDVQCLFVAMALQFRILLVNGQTKMAEPYIKKIRERIQRGGRDELESSLDALECRAALYGGNMERIEAWLEYQAPDENKELYMMDMYAYPDQDPLLSLKWKAYDGNRISKTSDQFDRAGQQVYGSV